MFRKRIGLSQQKFADLLSVSRSYLGDIESGRSEPSTAFLSSFTSITDGSADWLLTGQGEMFRSERTAASTEPEPQPEPAPAPDQAIPADLAAERQRVATLLETLAALSPESRDALLTECQSRAEAAQRLAELERRVAEMGEERRA